MEISQAKQGDPPIGASTTFLFLDREIVPLIRFGSLNRGSELARVNKNCGFGFDHNSWCRNNEAYYAHPALSAHLLALLRKNAI
jgi:hypothetical protein